MPQSRLAALDLIRQRLCAEPPMSEHACRPADPAVVVDWLAALSPAGSWADIDYANDSLKDWTARLHLMRLGQLAHAWHDPASPLHRSPALLAGILRGLDGWYARNPQNPNWWWNQIGAPLLLAETLLRLKGACDPSYITRAEPAFLCHEPIDRFTGQNMVWTATVKIYHGILTDNPARATQGFILVGRELRVLPGEEGLQPDMSFHQHGNLLYSGGYGQGFAGDVGRLIALSAGTAYAFPPALIERFARFLLDGSRWMVRGKTFDPVAIGREISRCGHGAARFVDGLRYLAAVDHPRRDEARAAAAVDPAKGLSLVSGNRHFWCSDLMTQHRPAYYLSVRLASPRVLNADMACCGGEGRLCHHMADGVTLIMRDGNEYRDLFPAWNWRQIPGATIEQEAGDFNPETLRRPGENAFAGGASDGSIGCAAMNFSRFGLKARKAWFLFDEGLVALGCGITSNSPSPVRTTLNQCHWRGPAFLEGQDRPLAEGSYDLAPGVAFRHDGILYRILDGKGTLRLGPQTGAWSDCGVGSPDTVTLPVLNAGLDHGPQPAGATYAYAVMPGKADADPFVMVKNGPALQAVWHTGERLGHAVFYEPGMVDFPDGQRIAVDRPCILLYRTAKDGRRVLTLAQPEQQDGLITIRLTGTCPATATLSLPVREYAGSSISLIL
jgi:chondroitin AC lyase